jgi:hypothetical protein
VESSLPRRAVQVRRRARWGATVLLLIVLVFQASILADTLHLRAVGRAFNALTLASFILIAAIAMLGGRARKTSGIYLTAVLLVALGCSINVGRNLSAESIGAAGALLPWFGALAVPFMRSYDLERSWRIFYRFMLWGSIISAIEYAAVFSGLLVPTPIETDRGTFLKGIFSIFFGLTDGTPHYRMYGLFAEPGTYAMLLLPAILFAIVFRKRWALPIFLGCLYFTNSLGGFFSLAVLLASYFFWKYGRRPVGLALVVIAAAGAAFAFSGSLDNALTKKGTSATIREDNVSLFRDNFVNIVVSSPFGLPLTGKSMSELGAASDMYLGSNFEIYTLFVKGGILAALGYVILFAWILVRSVRYLLVGDKDRYMACALVSLPALMLFIFQRETIVASPLFACLFAWPLLRSEHTWRKAPVTRERRRRTAARTLIAIMEGS